MNLKGNVLVVIVGANGFIGSKLRNYFNKKKYSTLSLIREKNRNFNIKKDKSFFFYDEKSLPTTLGIPKYLKKNSFLKKKIIIINAAGFAHKSLIDEDIKKEQRNFLQALLNDCLTLKSNLVHISSISAREKTTYSNFKYHAYSELKKEAEEQINKYFKLKKSIIILRFPAVWGESSIGSLKYLQKLLALNIPIPASNINVRKAYININSLTFLIEKICFKIIKSKNYYKSTFEVCDNNNTLKELIYDIAKTINKKPKIFYFPSFIIKIFLNLLGMYSLKDQLFNEVIIDNSRIQKFLEDTK